MALAVVAGLAVMIATEIPGRSVADRIAKAPAVQPSPEAAAKAKGNRARAEVAEGEYAKGQGLSVAQLEHRIDMSHDEIISWMATVVSTRPEADPVKVLQSLDRFAPTTKEGEAAWRESLATRDGSASKPAP